MPSTSRRVARISGLISSDAATSRTRCCSAPMRRVCSGVGRCWVAGCGPPSSADSRAARTSSSSSSPRLRITLGGRARTCSRSVVVAGASVASAYSASSVRIQPRGLSAATARCSRQPASARATACSAGFRRPSPLSRRHASVGLGAVQARLLERGAFRGVPVCAAACLEGRRKIGMQLQQVVHVVRRVGELRIGQRPPRPVGAGLSLVDRVPELAGDQFGIADLRRQAEQCGRHLRVEHRARHCAARVATAPRGPGGPRAGSWVASGRRAARAAARGRGRPADPPGSNRRRSPPAPGTAAASRCSRA